MSSDVKTPKVVKFWHTIILTQVTLLMGLAAGLILGGATRVTEDSPGWDCATMGDRSCESPWDMTDPYERCLSAAEGAHLPAWMWECREHEPSPAVTPDLP